MATLQGRPANADHAVVLGTGLAGMLTAAVPARPFEGVTGIGSLTEGFLPWSILDRSIKPASARRTASRTLLDINQMVSGPHAMGRPAVLAAALGPRLRWAGADPGLPAAVVSPGRAVQAVLPVNAV